MQEESLMSPNKSNRNLLIIIVVLFIAFGGLGYWHYYKTSSLNKQVSEKASLVSSLESEKTKLTADLKTAQENAQASSADDGYVVIKEWGVKFKHGSDLSNLYYYVGKDGDLNLATKEMLVAINAVDAQANFGAIGMVIRGKKGEELKGTTFDKAPGSVKIGEYYYIVEGPQSTFDDGSSNVKKFEAINALQKKEAQALKEAIKTLQASK